MRKISEIQLTETVLSRKIDKNGNSYLKEDIHTFSFNPGIESFFPRLTAKVIDLLAYFISLQFLLIEIYYTFFIAIIAVMALGSVFEYIKGTTLGKALFRLQVINDDGRKPGLFTSIKRNFTAPLNLFPFRISSGNIVLGFDTNFNNSFSSTYIVRKEVIPEIKKLQMEME